MNKINCNIMTYIDEEKKKNSLYITSKVSMSGVDISTCTLSIENNEWTVSAWYIIIPQFINHGFGTHAMRELFIYCINTYGVPDKINYIWNEQNEYIEKWLENFDAKCTCPLSVMKNNSDDDWESHIYELDIKKLFSYLDIYLIRGKVWNGNN